MNSDHDPHPHPRSEPRLEPWDLQISRYLDGELEGEEALAFEREVAASEPLRRQLEGYRRAEEAVRAWGDFQPGIDREAGIAAVMARIEKTESRSGIERKRSRHRVIQLFRTLVVPLSAAAVLTFFFSRVLTFFSSGSFVTTRSSLSVKLDHPLPASPGLFLVMEGDRQGDTLPEGFPGGDAEPVTQVALARDSVDDGPPSIPSGQQEGLLVSLARPPEELRAPTFAATNGLF